MEYYSVVYDNTIVHEGIKGMHWYDRRFQYEDGSLTPAGRERYLKNKKRVDKLKRSIPVAAAADLGAIAGYAAGKKLSEPLAKMLTKKYFGTASDEDAKLIINGMTAVAGLATLGIGAYSGTKIGKKLSTSISTKGLKEMIRYKPLYRIAYSDETLQHHGILGQKWGDVNGPPYPLSDSDHSASEKRAGWKKSLDNKIKNAYNKVHRANVNAISSAYQTKGLSKEEADTAAEKRQQIVKKAAICIGLAVGIGLGAYAVRYYGKQYMDYYIKSGSALQTVSAYADRMETGKAFYTAHREGDKQKYIGFFGREGFSNKFKITADVTDNIKIASPAVQKKIFNELMKNDPDFYKNVVITTPVDKKNFKYFNTYTLLNNEPDDYIAKIAAKAQDAFYKELKSKGYGGAVDVNDQLYSVFNTKADIIFDRSKIGNIKSSQLSDNDINVNLGKAAVRRLVEVATTPSGIAATGLIGTNMYLKGYDKKVTSKKNVTKSSDKSKISDSDVSRMKSLRSSGLTITEIAKKLGVSESSVSKYV